MSFKFTFISTTGSGLDAKDARSIRAHVNKRNFANKRLQRAQLHSSRHLQPHKRSDSEPLNIPSSLLVYKAHPLTSSLSKDSIILVEYIISTFRSITFRPHVEPGSTVSDAKSKSIENEPGLLDVLFSDTAMMEATIYLAAQTCYNKTKSGASLLLGYHHKSKAIRIISECLSDVSIVPSDGILTAVFSLAHSSDIDGDFQTWEVHMSGLARMLSVRLTKSQHPPPFWFLSLLSSAITRYIVLSAKRIHIYEELSSSDPTSNLIFLTLDKNTAELLFTIARDIYLMQDLDNYTLIQHFKIIDILENIENLLTSPIEDSVVHKQISTKALSIAMKIFLQFLLQRSSDTDKRLNIYATELRTVLQGPHIRLCPSIDLVFWELMMGWIATTDSLSKDWFLSMLEKTSRALQVNSWDQALLFLSKFFWIESVFQNPCRSAWIEVESRLSTR
ncbi:hypothetical protein F5884DRAFT_784350 [Xylogone sp. PMI_703]|nr:hypothetical protein F5884DRAFT_784350 [Xylogone sp. PMI_703]